jgi:hypothetical protein
MDEDIKTPNVIQFPNIKIDTSPKSLEELSDKITQYRLDYADEISQILMNMVLAELSRSGASYQKFAEDDLFPQIMLMMESIKSLYLFSCGVDHPLQDIAPKMYDKDKLSEMYDLNTDEDDYDDE